MFTSSYTFYVYPKPCRDIKHSKLFDNYLKIFLLILGCQKWRRNQSSRRLLLVACYSTSRFSFIEKTQYIAQDKNTVQGISTRSFIARCKYCISGRQRKPSRWSQQWSSSLSATPLRNVVLPMGSFLPTLSGGSQNIL